MSTPRIPPPEDAAEPTTPPEPVALSLAHLDEERAAADEIRTRLLDVVKGVDRAICAAQAGRAAAVDDVRRWTDSTAETGLPDDCPL